VEFLTDEQAEAYGKFAEEPTRPELERFVFPDDVDRDLIALRRTKHHQLGFALQMCTVRYVACSWRIPWRCRGRWWSTWPRSWTSRIRRWSSGTPNG
jgi:hypothetical protein